MTRLGTIFLILLAGAGLVFLLVIEPNLVDTRSAERARTQVLEFDPNDVQAIRVTSGEYAYELTRKGEAWRIGPEPRDRAEPELVRQLLDMARELQAVDFISASEFRDERDHGDFGLSSGENRIELELEKRKLELWFGTEGATDGRVYVRRAGADDVYLIEDALENLAFTNPTGFRDHRLSDLDPSVVDRVVMKRPDGEIELRRTPRGWEITRPLRARADAAKVERLLSPVLGTRIFEFIADNATDLSAFGPGEPRGEWIFYPTGDNRAQALRIGEPTKFEDNPAVMAQFTARDAVFSLPTTAWDNLQVSPDELRDRRLLDLNPDTIDAVRVRSESDAFELRREGDDWKLKEGPDTTISHSRVSPMIDAIRLAQVQEYIAATDLTLADAGLLEPAREIAFDAYLSENTPEAVAGRYPVTTIAIGKSEDGRTFVRLDDNPEICVISTDAVSKIPVSSESWFDQD